MNELLQFEQSTSFGEQIDDDRIRFPNGLAADDRHAFVEATVSVYWVIDRQVVAFTDDVVVETVGRGSMNQPGAGIEGDMVAEISGTRTVLKRMRESECSSSASFSRSDDLFASRPYR